MADFATRSAASLALLSNPAAKLNRRCGSFLGQCVVDPTPLSPKQMTWLNQLLERVGLAPLDSEEGAA